MIAVASPLPGLWVSQQHGTPWWIVREDYTLRIDVFPPAPSIGLCTLTIPAGYRYNRASIPDVLAWLVSKDDLGCIGPLVHDALYNCLGSPLDYPQRLRTRRALEAPRTWCHPWRRFTRAETDELFFQIMLADHVRPWRARCAFWAVRLCARRW